MNFNMPDIKELKQEIEEIISSSPVVTDLAHARSTVKWLLRLEPNADEAQQIAALAHDIERGFRDSDEQPGLKEGYGNYKEYKRIHSEKSARIISDLLERFDFNKIFVKKVNHLVLNHEFGGDPKTDILMDADSLSFFEKNLELYFEKYGEEATRKKIIFMYERMSESAKKLVSGMSCKNQRLNNIFQEETSISRDTPSVSEKL